MVVIPAIDLFGGRCVRLVKGDYGQPTVYSDNPLEVVDDFVAARADHLHVVDLDAARGTNDNRAVIESIVRRHDLKVQVAGGIRTAEAVDAWPDFAAAAGVDRDTIARVGEDIARFRPS